MNKRLEVLGRYLDEALTVWDVLQHPCWCVPVKNPIVLEPGSEAMPGCNAIKTIEFAYETGMIDNQPHWRIVAEGMTIRQGRL